MPDTVYVVTPGDCMASIAAQFGFTWNFLWNLPQNQQLKNLRKNPNVLMEGDQVFVPALQLGGVSCSTDGSHSFVKKGTPSKLRLRLLAYGRPRTDVRYVLNVGADTFEGKPDGDGYIEASLPPRAKTAQLIVFDQDIAEDHTLNLGYLDPIQEISGVQQRLLNLGLPCSVTGKLDDQTRAALSAFQQQQNLSTDGDLNDETRNKIQELHGA